MRKTTQNRSLDAHALRCAVRYISACVLILFLAMWLSQFQMHQSSNIRLHYNLKNLDNMVFRYFSFALTLSILITILSDMTLVKYIDKQ